VSRQQNAERRAAAGFALAEDVAARLLDDAVDHGKPEAGSLADLLGGEKRLEDLVAHVSGDAVAGILHLNEHIISRNQGLLAECGAIRAGNVAGAQSNPA